MKRKSLTQIALAGALVLPAATALADETNSLSMTAPPSKWSFDSSFNLFLAGLSGDVTAHGNTTHVDASFKDIFDHLEAGFAGRSSVGYQRWRLSVEYSYMRLTADSPAASMKVDQWLVEPTLGYKVCDYFEPFAGARYNNITGKMTFSGPVGFVTTGTQEWWDPIIGMQTSLPLVGKTLTFDGRYDVGGFGVESKITWQVYPYLNWRFAKWGSAQLGYRWLGTDYESGSGSNRFEYNVVAQGPQIGMTVHF